MLWGGGDATWWCGRACGGVEGDIAVWEGYSSVGDDVVVW